MRLLLVEDDRNLGKATQDGLRSVYAVDWLRTGEEAQEALKTTHYDIVVLDINLPGLSGLGLLRNLRERGQNVPVLLLTAQDAVRHRVAGLNAGADDYLVKPFDLEELMARCAALIRRRDGNAAPQIVHGDLVYEPATGHLTHKGKAILLSGRERAIFDLLIRHRGRAFSKAQIMEKIYDWSSEEVESNTVEVHIASLRRKLGKDTVRTIRNIGYVIE